MWVFSGFNVFDFIVGRISRRWASCLLYRYMRLPCGVGGESVQPSMGVFSGFLALFGLCFYICAGNGRNVKLGGNEKKLVIKTGRAYTIVILRKGGVKHDL
jgi:hypothetical protein